LGRRHRQLPRGEGGRKKGQRIGAVAWGADFPFWARRSSHPSWRGVGRRPPARVFVATATAGVYVPRPGPMTLSHPSNPLVFVRRIHPSPHEPATTPWLCCLSRTKAEPTRCMASSRIYSTTLPETFFFFSSPITKVLDLGSHTKHTPHIQHLS
jgi:hypothetical protein